MRTIILSGYRQATVSTCPWLRPVDEVPLLERQIRCARNFCAEPIVVLAGSLADEALRSCRSLEKCELVFDTYADSATLLTNLRSALALGCAPAVILPAELSFGDISVMRQMTNAVIRDGIKAQYHFLQSIKSNGQLHNQGFPLVSTYLGGQQILRNKELTSLGDSQIIYQYIEINESQALASAGNDI